MKNWLTFLALWFVLPIYSQTSDKAISGRVTDVWDTPIPNVNVFIKDTQRGTVTDESGWFSLKAQPNVVVMFSSLGYGSYELVIPEKGEKLRIVLSPKATELDEVTLTKRKRKTQKDILAEFPKNTNLVKTSRGVLNKDRSSSSFQVINGKDLVATGPDFLTSLSAYSPSMRVVRVPEVKVYLRRIAYSMYDSIRTPPKAIFDVDGFIQETAPTYLSSHDIDRIAILERNAAISRYGPMGVGGVIVINTKATTQMDYSGDLRQYDNSALRDSLNELFIDQSRNQPIPPD